MNDPGRCMETNVMGTQTMLSLCRKHDNGCASRMVFMSTSAIYGLSESTQFGVGYASQKETDSIDCLNAYSYSKYFGEQLCKMYSTNYGLDTVCFRGFNIYGNRMPKKGQYALVMGIFNRQIANKESLTIVGDGNQRRDFIHVSDVCRGLIAGATSNRKQNGAVYNLGSGKNYSINNVADMMTRAKYHKVQHTYIPPRNGEAKVTLADISKIKSCLDWEPKITLEEWIGQS
jgi:UDP-glucose 4-epimerase